MSEAGDRFRAALVAENLRLRRRAGQPMVDGDQPGAPEVWWPVWTAYGAIPWRLQNQHGEWLRQAGGAARRFRTAEAAIAYADGRRLLLWLADRVPRYPIGQEERR